MTTKNEMPEAHERIWLLPEAGDEGETLWCQDRNPTTDPDEEVPAIEYLRRDLAIDKRDVKVPEGLASVLARKEHGRHVYPNGIKHPQQSEDVNVILAAARELLRITEGEKDV